MKFVGKTSLIQRAKIVAARTAVTTFPVRRFRQSIAERILPPGSSNLSFEVDFFGLRYMGTLARRVDWSVFFFGAYEMASLKFLHSLLSILKNERHGSVTVFDVGANVGHHTLFFSRLAQEVHSFEPLPDYYQLIEEKLAYNRITNVRLHKLALGEKDQLLDYYQDTSPNSTGKFLLVGEDRVRSDPLKLPVRAGDDYVRTNNLPLPDLIKIDTDGFEGPVLRGLSRTINAARPIIFSEFSPESRTFVGSEARLRECLYRDAELFAVSDNRWTQECTLSTFAFSTVQNFLAIPIELKNAVLRCVSTAARQSSQ